MKPVIPITLDLENCDFGEKWTSCGENLNSRVYPVVTLKAPSGLSTDALKRCAATHKTIRFGEFL